MIAKRYIVNFEVTAYLEGSVVVNADSPEEAERVVIEDVCFDYDDYEELMPPDVTVIKIKPLFEVKPLDTFV